MSSKKNSASKKAAPAAKAVASTAVRNTPLPKSAPAASAASMPAARPQLSYDAIAMRAYEIWQRQGGSESDNWFRAEAELRAA